MSPFRYSIDIPKLRLNYRILKLIWISNFADQEKIYVCAFKIENIETTSLFCWGLLYVHMYIIYNICYIFKCNYIWLYIIVYTYIYVVFPRESDSLYLHMHIKWTNVINQRSGTKCFQIWSSPCVSVELEFTFYKGVPFFVGYSSLLTLPEFSERDILPVAGMNRTLKMPGLWLKVMFH